MTLPTYLESAVRDGASLMPTADWKTFRAHLVETCKFGAATIDEYAQAIVVLKNEITQHTSRQPIAIPNAGNLPPSPKSDSPLPQGRSHSASLDSQQDPEVWLASSECCYLC